MKRILGLLVALAAVVALVGCESGGDDDEPTYTVSGTAFTPAGYDNVSAHTAYMKLVASGAGGAAAPLYWASSVILAGSTSTTYSMGGIAAGNYEGWAFIDMNGNAAAPPNSEPDSGDWGTPSAGPAAVYADLVLNIPDNEWALTP